MKNRRAASNEAACLLVLGLACLFSNGLQNLDGILPYLCFTSR